MGLKIVCSGHLVRYPLGGFSWHHLQYLVGLQKLGHDVVFIEHYGWSSSCYNPCNHQMTSDPTFGIDYLLRLLRPYELEESWCFLAQDGAAHGMSRSRLAQLCRESDLYLNLSNINWIPEFEECKRRVLVDTDPVFTQIGAHGIGGPYSRYHALFTYGENVHHPECTMPTGGVRWLPTRQPIVLNLWADLPAKSSEPFTTVMNWSPLGDRWHNGIFYGQKDHSFEPFFELPHITGTPMELAVEPPEDVKARLSEGGWQLVNPDQVSRNPKTYQTYLHSSAAEFSVAKHGYVVTQCGWFSDRSAGYLASGRPVVLQETGYSKWIETGAGVIPFGNFAEACKGIDEIKARHEAHCRAAREIAEAYFDAQRVLSHLLDRSQERSTSKPAPDGAPHE